MIALREDHHGGAGGTGAAKKRHPQPFHTGVLIGEQAEGDAALGQALSEGLGIAGPFEKAAAGMPAQFLKQIVQCRRLQGAVGAGELPAGQAALDPTAQFEVAKVTRGKDQIEGLRGNRGEVFQTPKLHDGADFGIAQSGCMDAAEIVFAETAEVFAGEIPDNGG